MSLNPLCMSRAELARVVFAKLYSVLPRLFINELYEKERRIICFLLTIVAVPILVRYYPFQVLVAYSLSFVVLVPEYQYDVRKYMHYLQLRYIFTGNIIGVVENALEQKLTTFFNSRGGATTKDIFDNSLQETDHEQWERVFSFRVFNSLRDLFDWLLLFS